MKHKGKPIVFSQDALKSANKLHHPPYNTLTLSTLHYTHSLLLFSPSLAVSREFVTGFRKRRQQRRVEGAAQAAEKERRHRLQDRKEVHQSTTLPRLTQPSLLALPISARL